MKTVAGESADQGDTAGPRWRPEVRVNINNELQGFLKTIAESSKSLSREADLIRRGAPAVGAAINILGKDSSGVALDVIGQARAVAARYDAALAEIVAIATSRLAGEVQQVGSGEYPPLDLSAAVVANFGRECSLMAERLRPVAVGIERHPGGDVATWDKLLDAINAARKGLADQERALTELSMAASKRRSDLAGGS